MEPVARRFVKMSLVWLGLGVTLGIAMAVAPALLRYRTAHLHLNLLGFVAMMIFGVAYHVMPRFSGNPLHSRRLASAHFWLANVGLLLLVVAFGLRTHAPAQAFPLLITGGLASASGVYAFIYNIWRTLDGSRRVEPSTRAVPARGLPISG
jgi:cytochrome c oxidase cbb3-type subunit 1